MYTAAALFQKLCYENKDGLSAGIIVAGWDKENGPSVYNIPLGGGMFRQPWAIGGTSFRYYLVINTHPSQALDQLMCTVTAMLLTRTVGVVTKPSILSRTVSPLFCLLCIQQSLVTALSLAMSRDGSSGGVIRMCVITEDKVERLFVPGDQLPKFWEGREVLGATKVVDDVEPMAVEV